MGFRIIIRYFLFSNNYHQVRYGGGQRSGMVDGRCRYGGWQVWWRAGMVDGRYGGGQVQVWWRAGVVESRCRYGGQVQVWWRAGMVEAV